uniref:Cell division protein n=1 Tax=Dicloster acuatus TaxID=91190 RepID=A0A097KQE7_9CHLO|nr:cell division protein [Dicloster acuatus]AIT95401.1 cell division protein [Dicloster acuatus]
MNMNIENYKKLCQHTIPKIQLRISQHRYGMRVKLNSRSLSIFTIISTLPFFLGFYDFLQQNQQLKILMQKTLPTFGIPTETINWETFHYFSETKKDFWNGIEKVEWAPTCLCLTKTLNKKFRNQDYFFSSITNRSRKNRVKNSSEFSPFLKTTPNFGLNRFLLTSFNKTTNIPLVQTFYLNLDEIPLKIENLILKKSTLNLDNSFGNKKQIYQNSLPNLAFEKNFWLKNTNQLCFKKINYKKIVGQPILLETIQEIVAKENEFRKKPIPALNQLTSNQSINISPSRNNSKIYSLGSFLTLQDINSIKGTTDGVIKKLKGKGFFYVRQISGFSYPDMTSGQVNKLLLHNLFYNFLKNYHLWNLNKITLQINFPGTFTFLKTYSFTNEIPNFRIEYRNFNSKYFETKKKFSSIPLNNEKGLDWYPETNFEDWVKNYLSPLNPLAHSKSSLLGKQFNYQLTPVFNSKTKGVINDLNSEQWRQFSTQAFSSIKKHETYYTLNTGSFPVPLVEIELLESETIGSNSKEKKLNLADTNLNFALNSTVDYSYSLDNLRPKIKTLSALSDQLLPKRMDVVSYKKLFSTSIGSQKIYLTIKPPVIERLLFFIDNCESFTSGSWLLGSKICLAVLLFNFCQFIITDYMKELIWFLAEFTFAAGLLDPTLKHEIEIISGKRDKGFRVFLTSKIRLQNIGGVKNLLPEISELIWFLRNSGRDVSISENLPRGLLLIGPPGTGKTFLVQALAGEAGVPVVSVSGNSLVKPKESGSLKLEYAFKEARKLAPCILFIDEIDSVGQKRSEVMQEIIGGDAIISALESPELTITKFDFLQHSQTSFSQKTDQIAGLLFQSPENNSDQLDSSSLSIAIKIKHDAKKQVRYEKLKLLLQLLIELDGVHTRKGVVVIGATNRPEILDPALLRPGRLDKTIELGLPSYKKRIEIFKLYGKILTYQENISWDYLSRRTIGFSAADLASLMNQSSLNAILNDINKHTLETIEHGIERITTYEIEKPTKKASAFFKNRIAYYQAGKIVLSTILENHPITLISYLWPRPQNKRSLQILTNLEKYFFRSARRCELEDRIIGSYGGKAAEILFLQNYQLNKPSLSSKFINLSSFGAEDLSFAFVLICYCIEKWCIFSKSTMISQLTQIISNKNIQELIPEKIDFFKEITCLIEFFPSIVYSQKKDIINHPFTQNFLYNPFWQLLISQEFEFVEHNCANWYRLYLPNPEETKFNIEWVPPDEYYHGNLLNKILTKKTLRTWNDLHHIIRDYQVHAFVLQSFNKALSLLDENREYLDKIASELLNRQVLREAEIQQISCNFVSFSKQKEPNETEMAISDIKILHNSFGKFSRRKIKNWIDFKDFEK